MRWILLGPPGSGKGTQAKKLAEAFGAMHLSTGDLLRQEVSAGSDVGRQAQAYMERGDLVPDQLILMMIRGRLAALSSGQGFILDGFPRTESQAVELDRMLEGLNLAVDHAVLVDVGDPEVKKRLAGRARLEGRSDDNEAVIERRLDVYRRQTAPLIAYYDQRGLLLRIDGEQPIESVFAALERAGRS
ncbi:MAG: adenylate kinase [Candidatus Zixiibacteriota bacterium]